MHTTAPTATNLRREAKRTIDALSEDRLRTAADFLSYLHAMESDEATEELMRIPGAVEEFERGKRALKSGRTTPVQALRRKY